MARNYKKHKANKAARYARANSQPIASMFARAAAAAAPTTATEADENEMMEEEPMDEVNNNAVDDHGSGNYKDDGDDGDDDNNNDNTADPMDDSDGQWPTHVEAWIDRVKKDIDKAVKMTGKENQRRRMGKFPDKYKGVISPSDDPVSFFEGERITRDHFALPNLLVWYPEAQYGPDFYPYGRPPCKWHNEYGCCVSKGWMPLARHGYAMGRTFAIIGRKYYCKVRKEQGKECRFRNIDPRVIENSHDYKD